MKYHVLKSCFFAATFLCSVVFAQTPQNYTVLDQKDIPKNFSVPTGKILVLDFFSYGCPHCKNLAPYLSAWEEKNKALILSSKPDMKNKNAYIIFKMKPVAFESGWDRLSKAFHIADSLGIIDRLHQALFDVTQNAFAGLNSDAQMKSFFLHHDVKESDYDQAAQSALLDQQLKEDKTLLQSFKIVAIPTVIVARGKQVYIISNTTVAKADPKKFIETLTQLTQQKP